MAVNKNTLAKNIRVPPWNGPSIDSAKPIDITQKMNKKTDNRATNEVMRNTPNFA